MALLASLGVAAMAQGRSEVVAGWTLADPATAVDNGSNTVAQISKTASGVTVTYVTFAKGEGGSVSTDFPATKSCRDQWFGARLIFDDPAVKPADVVRREIHDAFLKFAAKCGAAPVTEAALMAGFGEAFAAANARDVVDAAARKATE
jgi:hypothetical protein